MEAKRWKQEKNGSVINGSDIDPTIKDKGLGNHTVPLRPLPTVEENSNWVITSLIKEPTVP